MMNKGIEFTVLILTLAVAVSVRAAWGWNDEVTHKDLTNYAADKSALASAKKDFFISMGFTKAFDELLPAPVLGSIAALYLMDGVMTFSSIASE